MQEIKDRLAEKRDEIKKLQDQVSKDVKVLFNDGFKEIFESCPELVGVRWTQYTPYFNDGDACNFRSYHECPIVCP